MRILYTQFFRLEDLEDIRSKEALENLRAIKETLALLSDDSLWYGSYVPNLLRALVNAGDSVGAIEMGSGEGRIVRAKASPTHTEGRPHGR